ncbi:CarD family transcriptional regulator [Clostridium sp. BJN0001]|uniref:CarD family transcriptional regulator n=1 Tax=Clostridium sp. BJN0001 TaxID=2930219 RepID=UPI001FD190B0|nr:CarD family transcriptional regulator [Clostridium sp. BJN0001]
MFSIGDKVVYPMQGIGIIEKIENKTISDEEKEYLKIKILSNDMEIMIPTDRIETSNLRKISDNSELTNVINVLSDDDSSSEYNDLSFKERYQLNFNKIKTGTLENSAEVVHDLMLIKKNKNLNSSEKQLLKTARRFLVDEVSVMKNISTTETTELLGLN